MWNRFSMTIRKARLGIRETIIFVFLGFMMIPLLLINSFFYSNTQKIIKDNVMRSLANITEQINHLIKDQIIRFENMSAILYSHSYFDILSREKYIADSLEMYNDTKEIDRLLAFFLNTSPSLDGVFIFTTGGNRFYKSNSGYILAPYEVEKEEWYKRVLDAAGKNILFGAHNPWPIKTTRSEPTVFSMSHAIKNMQGKIISVLLIDIDLSLIKNSIQVYQSNSDSNIMVIDDLNQIVFADNISLAEQIIANDEIIRILDSNSHYAGGDVNINNSDYFVAYSAFEQSGWKIISITSHEVIENRIGKLRPLNLLVAFLLIILSIIMLIIVYMIIVKPIKKLCAAMKSFGGGDFSTNIDVSSSNEIGQMGAEFNTMVDRINSLIESEYKARLLKKESEFKALQAQINPHFIYNTLQVMSSIGVINHIRDIDYIAKSLSFMMRYVLKNLDDSVHLYEEIEHLRKYIGIQKIRLGERFTYEEHIQKGTENCLIMKLVLQPLIENSFIHGIENRKGSGLIRIETAILGDMLNIVISDNGKGMEPDILERARSIIKGDASEADKEKSSFGIGLSNVYSRLRHFYGTGCELAITSEQGEGANIVIKLPVLLKPPNPESMEGCRNV